MFKNEWRVYLNNRDNYSADQSKLGKFVLIKGEKVYGFYNSRLEAKRAAENIFSISAPYLIHQIVKEESNYNMGGMVVI